MIAAIASAALIVAGSLVVGQAVLTICGRRKRTWLAGPVGLALLLVICGAIAGFGGRGTPIAVAFVLVVLVCAVLIARRAERPIAPGFAAGSAIAAAALAGLAAAIPFIASGNVGILGVGLVNDDMASHLLIADWIDERFRPEPVLIDQGYPIGPHALVAGIGELLAASTIDVFAGLVLAIPALTALVAFSALAGVRTGARIAASALVALPYMAAAYLAQEAFKEPIVALLLLAFALLLPGIRSARAAVPLGVLAAGTLYVYSFPGLAWLAGTAVVLAAVELARGRRVVDAWPAVLAAIAVMAVLALPDLSRLQEFADFRALDPDRANEGGLGNLPGHLSPLEALGIWPTSEFRLSAAASSLPAVVFYAGALLAAVAFAIALPSWLRRHGPAIPGALLTAAVLYLAARAFGTVYTSAKALAIAAPLLALITLGGLLDRSPAGGAAGGAVGDKSGWETSLRSLAAAFAIAAAFSSFLILRQAPVAPEGHMRELAAIRPMVEGEKLLFLGRDNFVLYELRGSKPFTHVRNFYDPYFVEPNFELKNVASKFDFDSVDAGTLARFRYVLTTRAAYASGPPPGYERLLETDSYALWERGGRVRGRRPGETGAEPGRLGGCTGAGNQVATFSEPPITAESADWSAITITDGESAETELQLSPGRWELSLQYDSTRALRVGASGFEETLPANLDYRGPAPFWAVGRLGVSDAGQTSIRVSVEDPPLAGRLLGADSVAHLGSIAATRVGGERLGDRCRGYVDWYVP